MYHVLCIDDEQKLLDILKFFLEQSGLYSVDIVSSAPAALSILQSTNYDAIISDYQMPGINGLEFLKQIRDSGNNVPFILLTDRDQESIAVRALNEGADFYHYKDGAHQSRFTELSHKVRRAIQWRKAESGIRDREYRERQIINFLPDATFAIDTKGTVIAWNRAIEMMSGIPARDMLGKGDYAYAIPFYGKRKLSLINLVFLPPDEIRKWYPNVVQDGTTLESVIPHPGVRGEPRMFWARASLLYNPRGKVVGAIETLRDITERTNTEELLRQSEEKKRQLTAIIESTDDAVIGNTSDGIITLWNAGAEKIYGYTRSEILGKSIAILAPPDLEIRIPKKLEKILLGEHIDHYKVPGIRKDGKQICVSVTVLPVPGAEQNSTCVLTIARDITWKKRAEEEKNRLLQILDSSSHEIYSCDAETLRFIDVNKAARENLGYTLDELRTLTPLDLNPEITRESFESLTAPLSNDETDRMVYTTTHKRKDGTLYPVEVHLQLSRMASPPVFVAIIPAVAKNIPVKEALQLSRFPKIVEEPLIKKHIPQKKHSGRKTKK
ncbi:MAG TPA: PAS domain S-box protein [Methanoregula sp.]|nr:PAS domain S-box protein [Methanoregula sp.]